MATCARLHRPVRSVQTDLGATSDPSTATANGTTAPPSVTPICCLPARVRCTSCHIHTAPASSRKPRHNRHVQNHGLCSCRYYDRMFESEAMTEFMRGAVQAWEYSRLHLEHWRQQQLPGVRYVSSTCAARCNVDPFRTNKCQSSLHSDVSWLLGDACMQLRRLGHSRCRCATMPVWSTS